MKQAKKIHNLDVPFSFSIFFSSSSSFLGENLLFVDVCRLLDGRKKKLVAALMKTSQSFNELKYFFVY